MAETPAPALSDALAASVALLSRLCMSLQSFLRLPPDSREKASQRFEAFASDAAACSSACACTRKRRVVASSSLRP